MARYVRSIKFKLLLIFGLFIVLISGAIGTTIWTVKAQIRNGDIINVAGRQRMFSQKMAKDAFALSTGVESARESLSDTSLAFDQTLYVLVFGGMAPGNKAVLPPTTNPGILAQLEVVQKIWGDYNKNIDVILDRNASRDSAITALNYINNNNIPLLKEMNKAVQMYTNISARKSATLIDMQGIFFILTVLGAVAGCILIIRLIVNPVAKVSKYITKTADQLSVLSIQIYSGAKKQSTQTEMMATAIEEMSATIKEIAENCQNAVTSATNTQDTAVKGGEVVKTSVTNIASVAEAVKNGATAVEELGRSSDQIGEIVSVINDIADQTNLLALNAAIEAARAGDQGRGFAVVADEVRKLAEKTSKATKQIASKIELIQAGTGGAIESMHAGTQQVEDGVQLANTAGEALTQIVSSVNTVTEMIRQIASAAEEQSSATEEITANITEIANISRNTTQGVKDISTASNVLNNASQRLEEVIGKAPSKKKKKKKKLKVHEFSEDDAFAENENVFHLEEQEEEIAFAATEGNTTEEPEEPSDYERAV